jgi:hypothetical protein
MGEKKNSPTKYFVIQTRAFRGGFTLDHCKKTSGIELLKTTLQIFTP